MFLARVTGCLWCSAKNDPLEGKKLMIVQPLDAALAAKGKPLVAVDAIGAGSGEMVYCCKGKEASFPWLPTEVPTDLAIVGIVDEVELETKSS
jgi:ethanolamine utilization protein EutN